MSTIEIKRPCKNNAAFEYAFIQFDYQKWRLVADGVLKPTRFGPAIPWNTFPLIRVNGRADMGEKPKQTEHQNQDNIELKHRAGLAGPLDLPARKLF